MGQYSVLADSDDDAAAEEEVDVDDSSLYKVENQTGESDEEAPYAYPPESHDLTVEISADTPALVLPTPAEYTGNMDVTLTQTGEVNVYFEMKPEEYKQPPTTASPLATDDGVTAEAGATSTTGTGKAAKLTAKGRGGNRHYRDRGSNCRHQF